MCPGVFDLLQHDSGFPLPPFCDLVFKSLHRLTHRWGQIKPSQFPGQPKSAGARDPVSIKDFRIASAGSMRRVE